MGSNVSTLRIGTSAVFVLIALRALRFEPIWVWLSGLTAALGWTVLAIFAWRQAGAPVIRFRHRPTAAVAIVLAILLLVVLGLIELIGRPPVSTAAG